MATWTMHLFGAGRLSLTGRGALAMPGMWWALIGSLIAAPNRRASRLKLASELWPDKDEHAARRCLATALWRLKSRLPGGASPIEQGGEFLALFGRDRLWIDALAFERRAREALADPASLAGAGRRARLARALALYRDAFLRDQEGEAIAIERERLRSLYLDAAYELAAAEARAGCWAGARSVLQKLVAAEPLREDAQRLLIAAHVECGNRGLAIQHFHAFSALLADELGVTPMPETLALAARIGALGRDGSAPSRGPRHDPTMHHAMTRVRRHLARTLAMVDRSLEKPPA